MRWTCTLEKRKRELGNGLITVHDGGYRSLLAHTEFQPSAILGPASDVVAYIEIPKDHSDVGKGYNDLDPEVNGGLTFAEGRVFGWDYGHAHNDLDYEKHIENAPKYFRARESKIWRL